MKRYTLYLDEKLISEIKVLAEDQKRSLSFMVSVLLQSAIREKQRKKKGNPKHNSANSHQNNAG